MESKGVRGGDGRTMGRKLQSEVLKSQGRKQSNLEMERK